jgi:hypothetical protein
MKILVGGRYYEPKLMECSSNTTRERFHRNNGTCVSKGEFKSRSLLSIGRVSARWIESERKSVGVRLNEYCWKKRNKDLFAKSLVH